MIERRSFRSTFEYILKERSAVTLFTGMLKQIRAISDSLENWDETIFQNSTQGNVGGSECLNQPNER